MAQIVITVPDAAVMRVLTVLAETSGKPIPAQPADRQEFANRECYRLLRDLVLAHERNQRMAAAMAVDPLHDPLHDPD